MTDSILRAWLRGYAEAGHTFGTTYDDDPESPRSRAYDLGRNVGERAGIVAVYVLNRVGE